MGYRLKLTGKNISVIFLVYRSGNQTNYPMGRMALLFGSFFYVLIVIKVVDK